MAVRNRANLVVKIRGFFFGSMRTHEQVCVRTIERCICTLHSRTSELHFLGLKASLFDAPRPLDP